MTKVVKGEKLTDSDLQQVKEVSEKSAKVIKSIQSLSDEMTPEQEYFVGRSIATNILAKNQYRYLTKEAIARGKLEGITAYVNQVGGLVAAAAQEKTRKGDRPAPLAGWHFVVVDSPEINAYASPGGYIFVTTGALKTARSEDELAGILGHEVAHVMRGHALGNIKQSRYANVGSEALQAAGSATLTPQQVEQLNGLMEGMIDDTLEAIFVKGYSRDTEFEADKLGVELAAAAGYDPGGMGRFLDNLASVQDTGKGGMFATHPKATDRRGKLAKTPASKVPGQRVQRYSAALAKMK